MGLRQCDFFPLVSVRHIFFLSKKTTEFYVSYVIVEVIFVLLRPIKYIAKNSFKNIWLNIHWTTKSVCNAPNTEHTLKATKEHSGHSRKHSELRYVIPNKWTSILMLKTIDAQTGLSLSWWLSASALTMNPHLLVNEIKPVLFHRSITAWCLRDYNFTTAHVVELKNAIAGLSKKKEYLPTRINFWCLLN